MSHLWAQRPRRELSFHRHTTPPPGIFSSWPLTFGSPPCPTNTLTLAGQRLAVGLGTLALALGHTRGLKTIPCFILMEELEKLRLKALLWE